MINLENSVKFNLFCLVWDYKTLRVFNRLWKIFWILGDQQKSLNIDILWHNWLLFGFRVTKHFLFCFIWDYKTSRVLKRHWKIPKTSQFCHRMSILRTSQLSKYLAKSIEDFRSLIIPNKTKKNFFWRLWTGNEPVVLN
jgi:hypothetical protein